MPRRKYARNPLKISPEKLGSAAVSTKGTWERGPLDGSRLGTAVHQFIQTLLEAGFREPTAQELVHEVAAQPILDQVLVDRLRAHQDLFLAASIYFGRFARKGWELIGVEVACAAGRFDIVWRRPDGVIVIDELKTEKARLDTAKLRSELEEYRLAALALYGDAFGYIRLLILNDLAPGRSFAVARDGGRLSIGEED